MVSDIWCSIGAVVELKPVVWDEREGVSVIVRGNVCPGNTIRWSWYATIGFGAE